MNELLKRMKSPVFWTEMALIVALFLRLAGVYDMPTSELTALQDLITALFTAFASLNNPADKYNF